MKTVTVAILFLIIISSLHGDDMKQIESLGKTALTAIKAKDKKAFKECWAKTDDFMETFKSLPEEAPVPKGEELVAFRKYFDNVQIVVDKNFDSIQAYFSENNIPLNEISFEKIKANIGEQHGLKGTSSVTIFFSTNGNSYSLRIDDAYYIQGKWKFTDKPDPKPRKL